MRTEDYRNSDGLTFEERLTRLETRVYGDRRGKIAGLEKDHDETRRFVEDLQSWRRQRALPWYLRWFVRRPATRP